MRMMKGFLPQMVLLIAVVTAVLDNHHSMAAAAAAARDYSGESKMNITTYGSSCVGLHCLVADNVPTDLFMDQLDQLRRMLASPPKPKTDQTKNPNQPGVDCQGQKALRYSTCLPDESLKPCIHPDLYRVDGCRH